MPGSDEQRGRWRELLAQTGGHVFTTEMLSQQAPDLAALERMDGPVLIFLEPPSLDARIVNQFALFSLLSSADACLDDWFAERPDACERVIIPAGLKWEIRDRLDQANITERVLYPGLDGLTRWLSRYYTPRVHTLRSRSRSAPGD